ncbi:MAG: hypothetical protein KDA22_02075 [Phycisphaerales bacterium]|nr:hypothetical protein [Phycisphaerales bacterium]
MTNRKSKRSPSSPRHAPRWAGVGLGLAAIVLSSMFLAGCGGEEEKPVVVAPPPPPPPPPPPRVATIEELMSRLAIDQRVRLPEELAPASEDARVAVLQFFDAIVRGDGSTAGEFMSLPDRLQLEAMQKDGSWAKATEGIARVDLRAGRSPLGDPAVLAVFHVGRNFEPQLWTYHIDNATAMFDAEPTPPGIMNQLSGEDWIGAWYKVLSDELAKADQPDELVTVPQQSFDKKEDAEDMSSSEGGGGPGPARPRGPGSPGKRPVKDPIDPPPFMPSPGGR